ncbi:polysaccharide biosynthesis/export family protein [uncultured Pontibacter sp.]|uniref:polysaccharide biosynthesis/export family protein n=1 Tax=uncultured Pontibacter sp. TaxID=453356 RepID=UPI0026295D87|nr:polysaccharide biosynthesis/export family protein [uncultured Pontibacter sp.]
MGNLFKTRLSNTAILVLMLIFTSCVHTREAVYFDGVKNAEFTGDIGNLEPVIQENDLLSITVSSLNPEASQLFNVSNVAISQMSTISGSMVQASGYLVDQDGFIQFPFLGNLKAAGMTKKELQKGITTQLVRQKLLLEPIVNIRYLNYKVSVLGEVARPSVLTIPNEKVTLLEALGLAGDLTIYAKRDNVLLIREENGKKKLMRIDLTSDEIFSSPNYYLRPNDIIYVEPNKSKVASTSRVNQWLPLMFSALSFGIIAVDRLAR